MNAALSRSATHTSRCNKTGSRPALRVLRHRRYLFALCGRVSASFYERRHDLDLFFKISLRDLLSYPYERVLFSDESRDRRDVGSVDLVLRVDVCRNHSLSHHVLIGTLMDVLRRDRIVFSNHRALLDRRSVNFHLLTDVVQ